MNPMLARWAKIARLSTDIVRAGGPRGVLSVLGGLRGAMVQIENTSHCNFRCTYCVTHSENSSVESSRNHMSLATFERILDDRPDSRWLIIQGQGEPLVDPTLFQKLASARARGKATQLVSNGSLLTPAMRERLWSEGPDLILFSVDVASPETNEANRLGMKYQAVTANIRNLTRERSRASRPMGIGLLSVVPGRLTDEMERALLSFNELGIDVLFYKPLNGSFENRIAGYRAEAIDAIPERILRQLSYAVHHEKVISDRPCAHLARRFGYYRWDGSQTPCCVLTDERYTTSEWSRERLLEQYAARNMPVECERCSNFGGYS